MRIIIPKNLQNYELFKQLKVITDEMEIEEYNPERDHDLPSLYELIKITNPSLNQANWEFIYNVIFAKKGLLQVLRLMASYLHYDLKTYDYEDYNLTLMEISSVTTDDADHFFTLFYDTLNGLLFFQQLNIIVKEIIQIVEMIIYHRAPNVDIEESCYHSITPIYYGE